MGNAVNHPDHYQLGNGMETIELIEAATADLSGIEAFDIGNALKYLTRFKHKNGKQDLEKAVWYIQHLIAHMDEEVKSQIDALNAKMNGGSVNGQR